VGYLWVEDGDFFERRGREGFAKVAKVAKKTRKGEKEYKKYNLKNIKKYPINIYFDFLFCILFVFFCALCETFAPSAFKKIPVFLLKN
jgi:hypothetical protein